MSRPLIFMDPFPRTEEMIYTPETAEALGSLGEVVAHFGSRAPDTMVEEILPRVAVVIGQTAMPAERFRRAPNLRAIINVKANWEPNVDYAAAQECGVHVLSAAPAMAPAVAEFCVGQAIALGRGLPQAREAFRDGAERYGIEWGRTCRGLHGATCGLIGYGNLGRELAPLLRPFGCRLLAHDPWLSNGYLRAHSLDPMTLDDLLDIADVIFVLAGATTENEGFLDREKLERMRPGTRVVLASRAEVVDFDALVDLGRSGRLRVAIDVFPEEPVPSDSPWRADPNILFTGHVAGAIPESYDRIRAAMLDDIAQILDGKPPMRNQAAVPQMAAISNSR